MKKSILSLLLAVVLTFGATSGTISAFAETKRNEDTPVAQLANDDYVPFNERFNQTTTHTEVTEEDAAKEIQDCVESLGGEIHTYNSEEEYNKSVAKEAAATSSTVETYADTVEEVRKTFKVLDRNTSKPIQNAVVRLNGVPRYTDRNGEIKVTLTNPVYELYVEKRVEGEDDQYNPHMEFIYLEDEDPDTDKTIYLKRTSDDLEVYAVNLRIGYAGNPYAEYYNLLEQEYHFALDYMDYGADIIIETNKTPDFTYLYVNGKKDRVTIGNDFLYFDYNKTNADGTPYYKPGDKFSVRFKYDGVLSKEYELLLSFTDLEAVNPTPEIVPPEADSVGVSDKDYGLFGNYTFDYNALGELIKDLTTKSKKALFKPNQRNSFLDHFSLKFSSVYNGRKGTIEMMIGFEFNKKIENSDLTKYREYQAAEQKVRAANSRIKENNERIQELQTDIMFYESDYDVNDYAYDEWKKYSNELRNEIHEYYLNEDYTTASRYESLISPFDRMANNQMRSCLDSMKEALSNEKAAKSSIDKLTESINGLKKVAGKVGENGTGIMQSKLKTQLQFEFYGTWTIDVHTFNIIEFKITGSFGIKVAYTWQFVVLYFPLYARIEGGFKIKIEVVIVNEDTEDEGQNWYGTISLDKFWYFFNIYLEVTLRGDVGVGLYDVLSVGGFAEFKIELKLNIGELIRPENGLSETYGKLGFTLGIRIKIFFFEYEIRFPNDISDSRWEWQFLGDKKDNKKRSQNRVYSMRAGLSNEIQFDSVYQNSEPQFISLENGKSLLVWQRDSAQRDSLNRTELVYSLCDNGIWSDVKSVTSDSGCADFYPQLIKRGDKVYLTWQRFNSKINDSDEINSMAAKSEIWFAEYNVEENSFNECQITNDAEMDLAPKFVLSNNNDKIGLLWQKNSENNILGLNGTNSIVYSEYSDGKWLTPEIVYTSNSIISYVTGAVIDGKLHVAFVEDCDKNPTTADDRLIKVIKDDETIYSDNGEVGNTQFVAENDTISLYYLKNQDILKTVDFVKSETILTSESGEFNFGFNVVSNENGTAIFYDTTNGEHKQSYCAVYDSVTNEWLRKVQLSYCKDNSIACTGFTNQNGTISYIHVMTDDEESYSAICFGNKEIKYDIHIEEAQFLGTLKDEEEFSLTILVANIGDYSLNKIQFEIFGQKQIIELKTPFISGEEICVNLIFVAKISNEDSAQFIIRAMRDDNILCEDSYVLFFGYTDVKTEAEIKSISGVQHIFIDLNNISDYNCDGVLNIYNNGKLFAEFKLSIDSNSAEFADIVLEDVCKGDNIYVEFVSYTLEKNTTNNSTTVVAISDSIKKEDNIINPYAEILNKIKGDLLCT